MLHIIYIWNYRVPKRNSNKNSLFTNDTFFSASCQKSPGWEVKTRDVRDRGNRATHSCCSSLRCRAYIQHNLDVWKETYAVSWVQLTQHTGRFNNIIYWQSQENYAIFNELMVIENRSFIYLIITYFKFNLQYICVTTYIFNLQYICITL